MQCDISIFSIYEVPVKMHCSCMYIQLYAVKVKLNLTCSKNKKIGCVRDVVKLKRTAFSTSNCRGPARSIAAISSFCFVPDSSRISPFF